MAVSANNSKEEEKISTLYEKGKEFAEGSEGLLKFISRDVCRRHLIARKWNERKAEAMLKETLIWRRDYKPNKIRFQDVNDEVCTGKLYIANHTDKKGNPVIIMRPRNQNTTDYDDQIRLLVYTLERSVDLNMNSGSGKFVWLIDFTGYTFRNAPTFKASKATVRILQHHYPERLEKAILFNPPGLFLTLWRLLTPFIDPVTKAKVTFVPQKKATEILPEFFELAELETQITGEGNVKGYDHESYCVRHSYLDEYFNGDAPTGDKKPGTNIQALQSPCNGASIDDDDDDELAFFDAREFFPGES